jgi:hypothetical protein
MAFDVTALTAYIEDRDFPLVAKLQFDPELKAAKATIQDGIKGSSNLHFMETSVEFQVDDCTRSASGTTTFSDKTITVGKIAIAEDLCMDDLENKWTQILLKKGVMEGRQAIPAEIAAIYMEEKMVKYKQAIAVADFQGDTGSGVANLNKYDGWIKFIDAGAAVIGNTGGVTVVTGVTVANILTILDAMYLARPTNLRGKDITLDMPQEWYDLYVVALKNANLFHYTSSEGETKLYGTNVNINAEFGLNGTNRMFLSYDSNYVVGMDADSDGDFTSRVDPVTLKKVLVDSNFRRGTQIQFVEDVVQFTLVL